MYLKNLKRIFTINNRLLHVKRTLSHKPVAACKTPAYAVGDTLHGYSIQQVETVPEFDLTAVRLRHDATGADHLHIDRQDSNNLFSVALKTVPRDDTGVAHILEHLVLCGSRNFPVRDPFFKMLTRSLATFMNAFTGPDYTQFPFSTQNPQDFKNLLQVYLDAAFFPKLDAADFRQEGWRLEHENVADPASPLQLKGVVFNEMKGVFSDPSQVFGLALLNRMFPDQTYRHNFGGDPAAIPSLTYHQLRDFHATYYHPSNARFVTYGDFPLADHLQAINNYVLTHFSKTSSPVPMVEDQPRWSQPRHETITCRHDPMSPHPDRQTTIGASYLLCRLTDLQESFNLALLCSLLVDGPNSPFHRTLLDSGLGQDYCPDTGYNAHTRQSSFTVGLQGIHPDNLAKVQALIDETFDTVIREGFPAERVEALLHSLELATKHQQTNFGLKLAMSVNGVWNHGGNPIDTLPINRYLDHFRKAYREDPQFLQDLVRRNFKENTHKLTLVMAPSASYEDEVKQAEARVLQNKMATLQADDKQRIYAEGLELQEKQKMQEDKSCLPSLRVSDVTPQVANLCSLEHSTLLGAAPLQLCPQPTNGVSYLRVVADVGQLPDRLKPWLPLFSSVLTKMGAGPWDFRELDQVAELQTSGLSASLHLAENHSPQASYSEGVLLSSYCLDPNLETMVDIWSHVLNSPRFQDADRLQQLVKMAASDLAQSVAHHGHHYVLKLAASTLSPYAAAREQFSGLAQVLHMKELAEKFDADLFLSQMKEIADIIFHKDNLRFALNGSQASLEHGHRLLEKLVASISSPASSSQMGEASGATFQPLAHRTHFVMPFDVNYVGRAVSTPAGLADPDCHGNLKVAARLLSSRCLHRCIREQGGAYGSGANVSRSGLFSLYSYRDPNVPNTLETFDRAVDWLTDPSSFTDQDLDEAKLGVLQEVDAPVSPGNKGMSHFLGGVTDPMRQAVKSAVLAATRDSLTQTVHRCLRTPGPRGESLLGPECQLTRDGGWTHRTAE